MVKFFVISVVMTLLAVSLAGAYAIGVRRYSAVGCGIAMKWNESVISRIKFLLIVIALPAIVTLVYNPIMWLYALCNFNFQESRISAFVATLLAIAGYVKLISNVFATGEHNGKVRATNAARRCKKHCLTFCEYANWGETVLDCQNPTCPNCPLAEQYEIKTRIHLHDVLEALYRHERLERDLRRRGEPIPTAYYVNIPLERVLNKVFDVEGWYDGFEAILASSEKPEKPEKPGKLDKPEHNTGRIIPFPVPAAAQPEAEPIPDPIPLEAEIVNEEATPIQRRPKFRKVAINRGDRGLKVEDCGTFLSIRMMWTDENGEKQYSEYTLDKTSPDCIYMLQDVAAIDVNTALQLQTLAIPAETI